MLELSDIGPYFLTNFSTLYWLSKVSYIFMAFLESAKSRTSCVLAVIEPKLFTFVCLSVIEPY